MPRYSLLLLLLLSACELVAPANPFDPESRSPNPGLLRGRLVTETGGALLGPVVRAVPSGGGATQAGVVAEDGDFTASVPPGTYALSLQAAGCEPLLLGNVRVHPGVTTELGALVLRLARGLVRGSVDGGDAGSAEGALVTLVPETAGLTARSAPVGADGAFAFEAVPAGRYGVRAARAGLLPAYAFGLEVEGNATLVVPRLSLSDGGSVVRVVEGGAVPGRDVRLAFSVAGRDFRRMRASVDPTFRDVALGDVEWRAFASEAAFTLPAVDGEHVIHASFEDSLGLETPGFLARVTLDRAAPAVSSLVVGDGSGFVREALGRVAITFVATDAQGVAGVRVSVDGALDDEPFESVARTVEGTFTRSVALGGPELDAVVTVQVRDAAGRVSEPISAPVRVDVVAPDAPAPEPVAARSREIPLLAWGASASADAARTRVVLARAPSFAAEAIAVDTIVEGGSFAPSVLGDGRWSWRVSALDRASNEGEPATGQSFVLDRSAPSPAPLAVTSADETSVELSWRAPDDAGQALEAGARYELRVAEGESFTWEAARALDGLPAPGARGALETFVAGGLVKERTYRFALVTIDGAGNRSDPSDVLAVRTPDRTPPGAVLDLRAEPGRGKLVLTWTQTGDDGDSGGAATSLLVFVRAGPLASASDFALADTLAGPSPGEPGTRVTFDLTSDFLQPNVTYSVALKGFDGPSPEANASAPSNVARVNYSRVRAVRPATAGAGDWVELDGDNLGQVPGAVLFGEVPSAAVARWTDTLVRVRVPDQARPGLVQTLLGAATSAGAPYELAPRLSGLFPRELVAGGRLAMAGRTLEGADGEVRLGGTTVTRAAATHWSDASVGLTVPTSSGDGLLPVTVVRGGVGSNALPVRVWSSLLSDDVRGARVLAMSVQRTTGDVHLVTLAGGVTSYRRLDAASGQWTAAVPFGAPEVDGRVARSADLDVDVSGQVHGCVLFADVGGSEVHSLRLVDGAWVLKRTFTPASFLITNSACRVSSAAPLGASSANVLVAWGEAGRVVAARSTDGGEGFEAPARVCPRDAACDGSTADTLHDVVGQNGIVPLLWVALRRDVGSASSEIVTTSPVPGALSFGPATVLGPGAEWLAGERVRGFTGTVQEDRVVFAWRTVEVGPVVTLKIAHGADLPGGAPPRVRLLSDEVAEISPTLATTDDGDISVVAPLVFDDGAGGSAVRHFRLRWSAPDGFTELSSEFISGGGVSVLPPVAAGGPDGTLYLARRGWNGPLQVMRTRLPSRASGARPVFDPVPRRLGYPVAARGPQGTALAYFEVTSGNLQRPVVHRLGASGASEASWAIDPPVSDFFCSTCEQRLALAAGPGGKVAIAWVQPVSGPLRVRADAADPSSEIVLAAPPSGETVRRPALAFGADGTLHVAWEVGRFTGGRIMYRRIAAGVAAPEVAVGAEPDENREPRVIVDASGTVHVLFRRVFGANTLVVRSASPGGDFEEPVELFASATPLRSLATANGPRGIELTWVRSARLFHGTWRHAWLRPPSDVGAALTVEAASLGVDPTGGLVLASDGSPDELRVANDLDGRWIGPTGWGERQVDTTGQTAVVPVGDGRFEHFSARSMGGGRYTIMRAEYVSTHR